MNGNGSAPAEPARPPKSLQARRLGIFTQDEAIIFMRTDCHVCRSEGLSAHSRVLVKAGAREVLATLYQVSSELLAVDEVGLSEAAWERLGVADGDCLTLHTLSPWSLSGASGPGCSATACCPTISTRSCRT